MPSAGQTVSAPSADDVPLTTDELARLDVMYVAAHFLDGADELVAYDQRCLYGFFSPLVPVEDMNVGAADGGFPDFYKDVVDADFGYGHIFHA